MPKLTVDGIEIEVPAGATVLQACELAGNKASLGRMLLSVLLSLSALLISESSFAEKRTITTSLSSTEISSEPYMRNKSFQRFITCLFDKYPIDVDDAVATIATSDMSHVKEIHTAKCAAKEDLIRLQQDEEQRAAEIFNSVFEEKQRRVAVCIAGKNPRAIKREVNKLFFDRGSVTRELNFGKATIKAGLACDMRFFELMSMPRNRGRFESFLISAVNHA